MESFWRMPKNTQRPRLSPWKISSDTSEKRPWRDIAQSKPKKARLSYWSSICQKPPLSTPCRCTLEILYLCIVSSIFCNSSISCAYTYGEDPSNWCMLIPVSCFYDTVVYILFQIAWLLQQQVPLHTLGMIAGSGCAQFFIPCWNRTKLPVFTIIGKPGLSCQTKSRICGALDSLKVFFTVYILILTNIYSWVRIQSWAIHCPGMQIILCIQCWYSGEQAWYKGNFGQKITQWHFFLGYPAFDPIGASAISGCFIRGRHWPQNHCVQPTSW